MTLPWILVTGNGAFGTLASRTELHYAANPSSAVALALDGEEIDGHRVVGRSLLWGERPEEALLPLLRTDEPPAAVISCGVFSGRTTVTVERTAVNVEDFQFAEDGRRPAGEPLYADGPAAYLATLPIKAMATAMRAAGVPALISNSASTHGCNAVMYTALHLTARAGLPTRCGFVHLPDTPEHVARIGHNGPSMSLALQVSALRAGLAAVVAHPSDIPVPANEWEW
ncbi:MULTISPECIES: pyroglutamyl-peptidase I family protein [unclassified Streptomyces]|uniref:pyroglutamyl-peptidase I family protein n=1 Tax=unclassified Streptomyces TaxID=2593676 RepID=UPI002E285671|nr:pyroglutamyl-peptidase I [Streptomyces sp. NBC_00690]